MRPRTEVAIGLMVLAATMAVAAAIGRARRPPYLGDTRPSSLLAGPSGARGLADALRRLGVDVQTWRRRTRELAGAAAPRGRHVLVLLDPTYPLEPTEVTTLAEWHQGEHAGDLVVAGAGTADLMQCYGWDTGEFLVRGRPVAPPGQQPASSAATATVFLEPDSSASRARADRLLCDPVAIAAVDTLLLSADGRLAAVRLLREDNGRSVVLVADVSLLQNRSLRESSTGPDILAWFVGRYDQVTFEEAHHGFGPSGSLAGAVWGWSLKSPWGWVVWQAAIVGILALLAGALRFGPIRRVIERKRRSPLEHVQALATALAAAKGHDVAIRATVRGLRRRLLAGRAPTGDPTPWLQEFAAHAPGPRARDAAERLLTLCRPGQPAPAVLEAANTVEDLWQELHP